MQSITNVSLVHTAETSKARLYFMLCMPLNLSVDPVRVSPTAHYF